MRCENVRNVLDLTVKCGIQQYNKPFYESPLAFALQGADGNDIRMTNVPDIRLRYRHEVSVRVRPCFLGKNRDT